MLSKTAIPGTVVFVEGISSESESFFAIVFEREAWKQMVRDFGSEIILMGEPDPNDLCLRILGTKVTNFDWKEGSRADEPNYDIVLNFMFRQANRVFPVVDMPQTIESLKRFYLETCRIHKINKGSEYISGMLQDLNLVIEYFSIFQAQDSKDRKLPPYKSKFFKILDRGDTCT